MYAALLSGGAATAGAVYPLAARRLSRTTLLWGSAVLATGGAALFTMGSDVVVTLVGAATLGLAGTVMLTLVQVLLSDQHGSRREQALTESNVGAAGCAVVAPLALGVLATGPLGWRVAFAVPALGLLVLYLRFRHQPLPQARRRRGDEPSGALPLACWLFNGLVAAGMAVEFCLIYFAAERLHATGLSVAAAATGVGSYYVGILAGRVGGAIATRRPGRSVLLLFASIVVTGAGFVLFWLSPSPAVAVAGLLVAGLGTANLYPLSVGLVLATAGGHADRANAQGQLLGGLSVTAAPFLLGALADRFGLTEAFALEAILVGLCLVLLVAGIRARRAVPTGDLAPPPG